MVRLCALCGEDVPGDACPRCGAPEPRWAPQRFDLYTMAGQLSLWLLGVAGGLACLLAAYAFCRGWIGPGDRIFRVIVGIVVVGIAVPAGIAFIYGSTAALLERTWVHPSVDGRCATATTRFGRLQSARGNGRTAERPVAVPANGLTGAEVFAHYGVLRRSLPMPYGLGNSPPRVDVALMATLLSLAGRGRLELRVSRDVTWFHDGRTVSRQERDHSVELRRTGALLPSAGADLFESSLMSVLVAPGVTLSPREGAAPYRAASVAPGPPGDAPWAQLAGAISAMSQGDPRFRRALRSRVEAATADVPPSRSAEAVCAELTATLDATGDRSLGAALLRRIEQGFSMRVPSPAA